MSTLEAPTAVPKNWRPSTVAMSWQRTKVELGTLFQDPIALVLVLLFPTLMMLLFGTVFSGMGEMAGPGGESVSIPQLYVPSLLASGAFLSSFQNLTSYVSVDRFNGAIKRLSSTPLTPLAYFLGKIGLTLVLVVVQSVLLIAVAALLFQVPLPADPMRWLVLAGIMLFATAVGATLGIALASVAKTEQAGSTLAVVPNLLLSFISGVYLLPNLLPEWLLNIAAIFPLRWTVIGLQYAFLPDWAFELPDLKTANPWIGMGVLAIWLVLGLVLSVRTFKWRQK